MSDLAVRERQILSGLKDFQRATVERIFTLLTSGRNRVLVADEVGLGKTLIARGVIAKTALYHQQSLRDNLFKVVYVCSNQSIAGQNLARLRIQNTDRIESLTDTRLSMQHLKIFEDEITAVERNSYLQLIPLTPGTSFNITGSSGSVQERALIFAILSRHKELAGYRQALELLMMGNAEKSWRTWVRDLYEKRVRDCERASDGRYLQTVLTNIDRYFETDDDLLPDLLDLCKRITSLRKKQDDSNQMIYRLRRMMAEISVGLIDADLVIMDEFQRFPELIRTDTDDEAAMLARRFFNADKRDNQKVKVLLLSATPYKLYSTLEEINESGIDEHYREFMQVIDFLFESNPTLKQQFRQVWSNYSVSLRELETQEITILSARKNQAENALYQGICRTERLSVPGAEKLVDIETAKCALEISEKDVLSYMEAYQLLQELGLNEYVPVEYVKSAPYIFSFMEHYKLKTKVFDYFKKNPNRISAARKPELWINENLIARYEKLPDTNARLKSLKEEALPPGAEHLIWIPPSKTYYEPGGPYSKIKDFSKILVFSSWEMVPRAIAAVLSYEAERLTVGKLVRKTDNPKGENRSYFPPRKKVRFPAPRLKFTVRDGQPVNMNLMGLLYPCVTLARLYNPIDCLNAKFTRREIEAQLRSRIEKMLEAITFKPKHDEIGHDERWYSVAPVLFDRNEATIREWLNGGEYIWNPKTDESEGNEPEDDNNALDQHFAALNCILDDADNLVLGRKPRDLVDVLVAMAMASPAVCAMRLFGTEQENSPRLSVRLAKTLINRFNSQEATSIVELCYGDKDPHWKSVLRYCVDGNLQAVLDEYAHMLVDDNGLWHVDRNKRSEVLCERMNTAFTTHTASYNVDTYRKFRERMKKAKTHGSGRQQDEPRFIKMRSGYAAGFYDMKGADKGLQRKESLRLAFNSPFRPFVLATTSIGQEGLDFHFYCCKIVHWNLPSNPIDLEQREGRINRYKCLAIRQNIAKKYGNMRFKEDIWREMFEQANRDEKNNDCPELVPFWCLPGDTSVKIERIVPMYPLSKDQVKYDRLIKILSLYRLSLGQARQEELLEYVLSIDMDKEQIRKLFINLSPWVRERNGSS
jgi:hypothetical protein